MGPRCPCLSSLSATCGICHWFSIGCSQRKHRHRQAWVGGAYRRSDFSFFLFFRIQGVDYTCFFVRFQACVAEWKGCLRGSWEYWCLEGEWCACERGAGGVCFQITCIRPLLHTPTHHQQWKLNWRSNRSSAWDREPAETSERSNAKCAFPVGPVSSGAPPTFHPVLFPWIDPLLCERMLRSATPPFFW